jgi:hypothetical protein
MRMECSVCCFFLFFLDRATTINHWAGVSLPAFREYRLCILIVYVYIMRDGKRAE